MNERLNVYHFMLEQNCHFLEMYLPNGERRIIRMCIFEPYYTFFDTYYTTNGEVKETEAPVYIPTKTGFATIFEERAIYCERRGSMMDGREVLEVLNGIRLPEDFMLCGQCLIFDPTDPKDRNPICVVKRECVNA